MDIETLKTEIISLLVAGPTELPEFYLWQYISKRVEEKIPLGLMRQAIQGLIDDDILEVKGETATKKRQRLVGLTQSAESTLWSKDGLRGVKI